MALPFHISKKLRQQLGDETGGDLVNWLGEMRAERERFRADLLASEARLVARMDQGFARVDERFAKADERLAGLRVAIADSRADLMKWMLVFWVGAVGAIAALAGVLR
jgi:hypothetical protein